MTIKRRKTRTVRVGSVSIGGTSPIAIQSMAKTDTENIKATVSQIKRLEKSGCEIVRVAVKTEKAARALKSIKRSIKIPLVADIHFSPRLAILAIENGADKIRINPGNMRDKKSLIDIVKLAKKRHIPIRIGLNSGSVPKGSTMVGLTKDTIKLFQRYNFHDIIISVKTSTVDETIKAYKKISAICNYPLHLGLTATGLPESGIVKSSICIGALLLEGIGDTIRVSLTGEPEQEVVVAQNILSSVGVRNFGPEVISCPTCGRCRVGLEKVVRTLEEKLHKTKGPKNKKRSMRIAIMGCEVNGPGEARDANIGIAAGNKTGVLFKKGKIVKRLKEKDFVKAIIKEIKK